MRPSETDMRSAMVVFLGLLAGCNRYDLFRVTGYEQASFSNRADVLFVIDNSDSMLEESESLAVNFANFIQDIDSFEAEVSYEGLADAVTNYADYVQNRAAFIDYQFGITTTDAQTQAGELIGPTVKRGDDNVGYNFTRQLACEATCFGDDAAVPQDDDYECGEPLGAFLSEDYLACACGDNDWRGNCGAAKEEGLEAVFLAMCRAVPNPPVECFADVNNGEEEFVALLDEGDKLSNDGMLRENANFIPVIVSDEGDSSRRTQSGEAIPEEYANLFASFRKRMSWVFIGPGLDSEDEVICPGTAADWAVVRYNYMVHVSDGLSIDIYDDGCNTRDFQQALEELSQLLTNLLTAFPLQSVPVPGTLAVLVDGELVEEATVTGKDEFDFDVYSDGYSYRAADNAIVFHGAAIPNYNAKVEVYYKPVDGMPRDLPF
jgi:hypothetical protein